MVRFIFSSLFFHFSNLPNCGTYGFDINALKLYFELCIDNIIVKENKKSKKNKKSQSDLIRSLLYKTYRKFVKISNQINYGKNNKKHIRNKKIYW